MKRLASCLVLLLIASYTVLAAPDTPASHFDQLKKLAGTWEGKTADGKRFTFNFLDATNLATPDAGHMHRMILTIEDANHMTQQWFFLAGTKEQTETFRLARKQ